MANITIELDDTELWSAVFGSAWDEDPVAHSWCMGYQFIGGADWETVGMVCIQYIPEGGNEDDCEDESKWDTVTLGIKDIERGLSIAVKEGYRHVPCGGNIGWDFEDYDSCVGELILQLAVYGKEVWA